MNTKPQILAPAGDLNSFSAALAAKADAVYVGLKNFSARMLAHNFSTAELARMVELARRKKAKVYLALNSFLKQDELDKAGRLIERLLGDNAPAGLIVQDLGMAELARQTGYQGELHLSTLANLSSPAALSMLPGLGISRVVAPRELNVDELRNMAEACPAGVGLEVFVHGALCYNVSGRCYWSGFLGGKSGLRGRCVQPCRRNFSLKGQEGRHFSCQDLSLDVLAKTLLTIPQVQAWKIEGRKKGPHYVYHTVSAYRLFRDHPDDPKAKAMALEMLEFALGRKGTHYTFLPQHPFNPVEPREHLTSGLLAGRVSGGREKPCLSPRVELLPGDILRIGQEDDVWHHIATVTRFVPKGGRLTLRLTKRTPTGTPVHLIDRREPELARKLGDLNLEFEALPKREAKASNFVPRLPKPYVLPRSLRAVEYDLWRQPPLDKIRGGFGVFASTNKAHNMPLGRATRAWWWLPPAIWPGEESDYASLVDLILRRGGRSFVLGAPWQRALFPAKKPEGLKLWAGPYCNIANSLALNELHKLGFDGAIVSPELSGRDILELPKYSPLPLGIVQKGLWPLGVSRILGRELKTMDQLASPKGEICWTTKYDGLYWIFPGWEMDITAKRRDLEKAGYVMFVNIREPWPKNAPKPTRTSVYNWDVGLL